MTEMVIAILAGLLALIAGAVAGYYLGRPARTAPLGGLLGQASASLGIKL